jgi:hypothetical protein
MREVLGTEGKERVIDHRDSSHCTPVQSVHSDFYSFSHFCYHKIPKFDRFLNFDNIFRSEINAFTPF